MWIGHPRLINLLHLITYHRRWSCLVLKWPTTAQI